MRRMRAWGVRLCGAFRRREPEWDLEAEIESHLALHIEDGVRSGMSPEDSRRRALIMLGGIDKTIEEYRDRKGLPWIADFKRNMRWSFRRMARSPLLSLIVVLSLGLGVGANTAVFSAIHHMLLRPLPVEAPEALALLTVPGMSTLSVAAWCNNAGGADYVFSAPGFRILEQGQDKSVAELAGFAHRFGVPIAYGEREAPGSVLMVSGGYSSLMRLRPRMGRSLVPGDDRDGVEAAAMLGYRYWRDTLGADPAVLNRTIRVGERVFTIVGVAPEGFQGTTAGLHPDVFIPLSPPLLPVPPGLNDHSMFWVYMIARLGPGVTREQAAAHYAPVFASVLDARLRSDTRIDSAQAKQWRARRLRLVDGRRGYSTTQDMLRTPLWVLMAASGMVLLIAMANASNLLLARSAARRRELAISAAVGASRWKIAAQLLMEALTLALAGGAAAVFLGPLTLRFLSFANARVGGNADLLPATLAWPVLFYGLAIALASGLLFSLYPALEASRVSSSGILNQESGHLSEAPEAARIRKVLVCAQMAIAVTLLIPAGLFLKSLNSLMHLDLGFQTDQLVAFTLNPEAARYSPEARRALFERVEAALASQAGIRGVTAARAPLISNYDMNVSVKVEGAVGPISSSYNEVGAGFFRHMGIPLVLGREFAAGDSGAGPRGILINEQFARAFFPGKNPLGRRIGFNLMAERDMEIVGVVKDIRAHSVRQEPVRTIYAALDRAEESDGRAFYLRSALPFNQTAGRVRAALQSVDAGLLPDKLQSMEELVRSSTGGERLCFQLAAVFAALATALAMIGLYGVMAFSVVKRTREFGIRLALGARPSSIRTLVLKEMLWMPAVGLVVGIPLALCAVQGMQSWLFGVEAHDPLVAGAAAAAAGLAALTAAYLPAWRASRVQPWTILRGE